MNFIDRRLNPNGKSLPNRQRFTRRARETIKNAVARSIRERALGDIETKEVVNIPMGRIAEPRLRHAGEGGDRDRVFPGNKEFTQGDTLPKPKSGEGGRGREGSPDGEGEDDFQFTLTADEYLEILFEELELPDLIKTQLKDVEAFKYRRAGHSSSGTPSNLNLVRTMRRSLARRISLHRPKPEEVAEVEAQIAALDAVAEPSSRDQVRRDMLVAVRDQLNARARRVAYIDPVDLRYNRFTPTPEPRTRAVMFCLMDVSGSMSEERKDIAKRFFLLLHLFLTRKYAHVDMVFIRHTTVASEVDEDTFFHSRETGGTVVSTALEEMARVIEARYSVADWNIYAAQASDGDNYSSDGDKCVALLSESILPLCQYFAYIEVLEEQAAEFLYHESNVSELWRSYQPVADANPNFQMRRVFSKADVFPVFHQLFAKARHAA